MTKEEYRKALKSPKWVVKRKAILKRDNYTCVKCDCKNNLQVHHKYYIKGKMPWEVPDDCLVTLCSVCHSKEHENKKISDFIKEKPLKNVTRPKKVKNKSKNKNFKLTKEERELQNKYDILKNKGKLPSSTYIPPTYVKSKKRNKNKPQKTCTRKIK